MYRNCCDRPAGFFSLLRSMFVLVCVLLVLFFIAGYASGWITLDRDPQENTATIKIDTGEMKAEANQAAEQGEQLLEQAGDKIRELGEPAERDSVPTSVPATRPAGPTDTI